MEGSPGTSLIKWQHNLAVASVADAGGVTNHDPSHCGGDSLVQNLSATDRIIPLSHFSILLNWLKYKVE